MHVQSVNMDIYGAIYVNLNNCEIVFSGQRYTYLLNTCMFKACDISFAESRLVYNVKFSFTKRVVF